MGCGNRSFFSFWLRVAVRNLPACDSRPRSLSANQATVITQEQYDTTKSLFAHPINAITPGGTTLVLKTTSAMYGLSSGLSETSISSRRGAALHPPGTGGTGPERVDVRLFGTGEPVVAEHCVWETYEATRTWIEQLGLMDGDMGAPGYEEAVLV